MSNKTSLRLPYYELSAEIFKNMKQTKVALESCSLDRTLVELIYLRVSQINGCAFCLNMHAKSLRDHGENNSRLDALAGWKVSNLFSAKERAALEWTESVTNISATIAHEDTYLPLKEHFSDIEISDLTLAISLMNALNRVAISMRQ